MTPAYYRNLAADCLRVVEQARANADMYLRQAALLEVEARMLKMDSQRAITVRPPCGSEPEIIEVEHEDAA